MVCLGNICRSPLAEGILKHKVDAAHIDWEIDSAGTSAWHVGNPPDPRSIATAKQYGIDITNQRARQFQAKDLRDFDLILAMDRSNYNNILKLDPTETYHHKVKMIMDYVDPKNWQSVPDPYWDDDGFEQVYQMLDHACNLLIESESTDAK